LLIPSNRLGRYRIASLYEVLGRASYLRHGIQHGGKTEKPMISDERTRVSLDEIQRSLEESPFQKPFHLRANKLDATAGTIELQMDFVTAAERSSGTRQFHGGAIASLIDIAGDYALFVLLGHGVPTINLRIDYLRSATDTNLTARAIVRKAGRTVAVVDVEVSNSVGKLVALGRGTYGTQDR
jgi:uncharacterized protein (TIGR00369 family)